VDGTETRWNYRCMRKAFSTRIAVGAMLALGLASCSRDRLPDHVSLPPTPVLSIRTSWAVVTSPLLRIREQPSNKSPVIQHVRMGAVVEVIAKSDAEDEVENETGYWYRINYDGLKGWVFGSYVAIYDSRSRADAEAAKLQ
jgi:hypothetical protein